MVEAVGDDHVLVVEEQLEHATVGVRSGGEHDRVVLAEVFCDGRLELTVRRLRAAVKRTKVGRRIASPSCLAMVITAHHAHTCISSYPFASDEVLLLITLQAATYHYMLGRAHIG